MGILAWLFKPQPGYVGRVFQLSLHLITFGGRSAKLTYFVHKSGRKTATFTFQGNGPQMLHSYLVLLWHLLGISCPQNNPNHLALPYQ